MTGAQYSIQPGLPGRKGAFSCHHAGRPEGEGQTVLWEEAQGRPTLRETGAKPSAGGVLLGEGMKGTCRNRVRG